MFKKGCVILLMAGLLSAGVIEVHYELKHKMGVIARAGYDYFLAKNKKK